MKILRIIASMDPKSGGPCQGIRNSIPALQKLDIDNEVACLDAPDAAFIGKDTFKIHALGPAKTGWNYSARLVPWLLEHMPEFDVVITHGLWLYNSHAVYKAARILKKQKKHLPKIFVMPHGMLDPYFQKAEGRKLKALRNNVYWTLIERKVVNNADGVLFTCEAELYLARQSFSKYKPRNELNVGYGIIAPPVSNIEQEKAFYEVCPQVKGQPYILFLSRIHEKKGVDLLIKAYAELFKEKGLNLPKLVVAGPGLETTYGNILKEIVVQNDLEDSVFFPGMLTGNSKWGAYYASQAFILPSHQENFGIAVVEALACGKPVLISNQVNIWNEIVSGNGGIVVDDDLNGTTQLLNKWLTLSEEEKQAMHKNALLVFQEKFTVENAAFKLAESIEVFL